MEYIILGVALVLILVALLIYYFGEGKCDLRRAKKEFEIFGLKDGFVPQGLCYSKALDCFLMSGYMQDKKRASRVYVLNIKDKSLEKYFVVKDKTGELISHFGGITSSGENVWISTEGRVLRLVAEDIKNAKNGDKVKIIDEFSSKNGADFCFVYAGLLWIGEFYKLGKFKTNIAHHIKIDEKNQFHAMCFGFKISSSSSTGIEKPVPEKALAVPDITQGIAINKDDIFVSCSYGVAKSTLASYENVLKEQTNLHTYFEGRKIPLYILSKSKLKKRYVLPSMSEEIEYLDGKLYVLFESASKKYRLFTRSKTKHIFSFFMNKD